MLRVTFLFALVLVGSAPRIAEACSCLRPAAPRVELDRADLVFVGAVTGIVPRDGDLAADKTVSFEPVRVIKGPAPSPFALETAGSSAACGYTFEVGSRYLVYAHERDGQLWVSLCSRTALYRRPGGNPIPEVAAEIAELDSADPPPPASTPQRRGCAGCSSAAGSGGLLLALLAWAIAGRLRQP